MKDYKKKIKNKLSSKEDVNINWINSNISYPNKFSKKGKKYLTQYYLSNHLGESYKNLKDIFSTRPVNTLFNRLSRHFQKNSEFEEDFKCLFGTFFPFPKKELIIKKQKIIQGIINSDNVELKDQLKKIKHEKIGLNYQIYFLENESEIESDLKKLEKEFEVNISALPITREELKEMNSMKDIIIVSDEIYSDLAISLEELKLLLKGFLFEEDRELIIEFLKSVNDFDLSLIKKIISFLENSNFEEDSNDVEISNLIDKLNELINEKDEKKKVVKELENDIISIDEVIYKMNQEIEESLDEKDITIDAKSIMKALKNEDYTSITKDFKDEINSIIQNYEDKFIEKSNLIGVRYHEIFKEGYPVKVDEESLSNFEKRLEDRKSRLEIDNYIDVGDEIREIEKNLPDLINKLTSSNVMRIVVFQDFINTINKTLISKTKDKSKENLTFPNINEDLEFLLKKCDNFFFDANPIDYSLNSEELDCSNQKISILTGANSGGKTTLLELVLQSVLLSYMGMPLACEKSKIPLIDNIYYFKKFSGRKNAGAFEQTVKKFIKAATENKNKRKLILIDEFESITEPDAAAKILLSFLDVLEKTNTLSVVVSHLGKELENRVDDKIRLDGIFAKGLDDDNTLLTNHQPLFGKRGKSTPELILQKIVFDNKQWNEENQEMKEHLKNLIKELK